MKQATLYKIAVIVHGFGSLFSVALSFPALLQGPNAPGVSQGIPQTVLVLAALLGVAGLISTYGAWYGHRWGISLTIFTEATNGLLALPGVLLAPTASARISAITGIFIAIFVIVTLLWRPRVALPARTDRTRE